jgi:hypothetical protein
VIRGFALGVSLFLLLCLQARSQEDNLLGGPVEYGEGFYDAERNQEGSWRWMAGTGVARLQNTGQEMRLVLVGRLPEDIVVLQPTLTISFNGQVLEEFKPAKGNFRKEYRIDAKLQGAGARSELQLHTDKTVVPSEVNKSLNDPRPLGFKLYTLTWERLSGEPMPAAPVSAPVSRPFGWLTAAMFSLGLGLGFALGWIAARWSQRPASSALEAPTAARGRDNSTS